MEKIKFRSLSFPLKLAVMGAMIQGLVYIGKFVLIVIGITLEVTGN